ncbi:MAG: alpha/beta hydrolase [Alphaproteobacteria bacterium]|nr:alpha/beta hydrolase [Alphaproteobacteria bacterium]
MTAAADLGFIHRFEPGREPAPVPLLLLHGTGGDENDLIPLAARIAPTSALLSPRGKVSEHGMARYFRRFADGSWDRADFEARTAEVLDFLKRARAAYALPKPMALGYSNGANVAWSMLLKDPGALAGAILMRAMLPFDPRPIPDLRGVPVLLLAGAHDELIPPERAGLLAALLGEAGADVTYEVLPLGHGLGEQDLRLAASWLASRKPG